MSVVVTVWGSVGMFVVYRPLLKIVFFSLGVLKYVVWGSVGMFVVYRPLLKIVFFSLGVLKYVVCLCRGVMDVVFSVCIVRRGAVVARVWGV